MWRKNRKPNSGGSFGVDQNRNYDIGWDGDCPGSTVQASETYRGPSAASEEETQIMKALHARYNIAKLLDYHSYGREVLLSFLCEPIPAALDNYIKQEGQSLAPYANYASRAPSADGQNAGWAIANHTPYAYLVETANDFQPPFTDAQAEAERVWPLSLAWLTRTIPVSGHVYSPDGRPVAADIVIDSFGSAFTYHSEPNFGRYHLFLPDGTYSLTVTADGYTPRSIQVTVDNDVPTQFDIRL